VLAEPEAQRFVCGWIGKVGVTGGGAPRPVLIPKWQWAGKVAGAEVETLASSAPGLGVAGVLSGTDSTFMPAG
jgi:hypothetical protein